MERKRYIDILKILAAFSIVILHVNSNSIHMVQNVVTPLHGDVTFYIHQILYLAVPVFVILTGAGLLAGRKGGYAVIWPQIRKILLCIIVFGSLFELANVVIRHEDITLTRLFFDLWNGTSWSHMWYLNRILGIYLIFPLLSYLSEKVSKRDILVLDILLFIFTSFLPFIFGSLGYEYSSLIPIDGIFVPYVLAGFLIASADIEKCRKILPLNIIILFGGIVGIIAQSFYSNHLVILENNPLAVIVSINIVLFGRIIIKQRTSAEKFVEELSRCTLGIYIIHPIFLHIFISFLNINPQLKWPFISVPLMALIIFILSFGVISILRKISFIRKYLL